MKKKWFFVVVPFIVVMLLGSCSLFGTPDFVGTWAATVTGGALPIPVTMVFTETTFSVTIDTVDPITALPTKYVITGDLAESATEGVLDATILAITQDGTEMPAANLAAFLAALTLTADQTFTYSIGTDGAMTISGALLLALTGATSITATAS